MTGAVWDSLFPMPDVSFIRVHTATLYRMDGIEYESDSEGFPVSQEIPGETFSVYVASPNPSRDQRTYRVDCVVLFDNTVQPAESDMIEIGPQAGLQPLLAGRYKINEVRPNPLQTRVLCTRPQTPNTVDTSDASPFTGF